MSKRIPILLGCILTFLSLTLFLFPNHPIAQLIERLEDLSYDLRLKLHLMTYKVNSQIAIIDINDQSIKEIGHWPWSRAKLATLVDNLKNEGAVVITFDILLSEKEENYYNTILSQLENKPILSPELKNYLINAAKTTDADLQLAQSLTKIDNALSMTLLPEKFQENTQPPIIPSLQFHGESLSILKAQGFIADIPVLQQAAKTQGFINIYADTDGIMRHAPIVMSYQGNLYPSLSLAAASLYLMQPISLVVKKYNNKMQLEGIKFGSYVIPTNEKGEVLVPFVGESYTFPYYSAADVLNHRLPKDAMAGKFVLVGSSATGLGDLHATAIQNPFPGVEIQASIINGILESKFSEKPFWSIGLNFTIVLLLGFLASIIFPYYGARLIGTVILLFPPVLILTNNWIWQYTGFILPWVLQFLTVFFIAIMNMIYGYLFESRRREQLKAIFGQYVPSTHIDEMLKRPANYGMEGEDRQMTVLFADIRNFTNMSEKMTAQELVHLLNLYLTPMTQVIFDNKGTIDKYVGDMIMAFWGAPLNDSHHATHGIKSAIEMQRQLKELNKNLIEQKLPEIHVGIGLNSGTMSIGDMGSRFRRNYTILGDAVNLGSRIESLTKYYGVDVMISETTFENQKKFIFRKIDTVQVKGKVTGVSIYEVIGFKEELTDELAKELEAHDIALQYYYKQQWDKSFQDFTLLHEGYPERKIYKIYLERIAEYQKSPPPADWNGVFVHVTK